MRKTGDRCRLCGLRREKDSDYCAFHLRALRNLEEAYETWRKATDVECGEFLRQASEIPETGSWAKEVAVDLSKEKHCM